MRLDTRNSCSTICDWRSLPAPRQESMSGCRTSRETWFAYAISEMPRRRWSRRFRAEAATR